MDVNPTLSRRRALPIAGAVGLAAVFAARSEQVQAAETSSTRVGLPYTVITEPTDAAVQAGIKAWRTDFNGAFPLTRLLFGFSGTANLTTPLDASMGSNQIQGVRWEGLAKRSTVLRWSGSGPLLSAYGLLRNWEFRDFSVQSGQSGAKGFYLRADNGKWNQDGAFRRIEWMGAWNYGLGFDGQDSTANLNSELVFDQPALSNDASFVTGWLVSGLTPGVSQQNQFLNYVIRDSKLEGSHGDYVVINYGGSLNVEGYASWIHTGQANGGTPAGRMLYLPRGGNGDSTMFLRLAGMRPELRGPKSVFIDSSWSGAGCITIDNLRSAANAFNFGTPTEQYTFRGDARISVRDSHLQGFIGLHGSAKPRMLLENTQCAGNQGVDWTKPTDSAGNGIVRTYDSASASNVKVL
ncbi:MAG: hypothetical protein ACRYG2_08925 [Janthinobacterium lividum]